MIRRASKTELDIIKKMWKGCACRVCQNALSASLDLLVMIDSSISSWGDQFDDKIIVSEDEIRGWRQCS
jgi:hypothetical protein